MNRPMILLSVMLGMFLSAIEGTIVATAIPTIVADLGGFSLYSWVFSAYLLTNAATILIFGKLSDIYGRKPIFVIGVLIFLLGSTLSGFSTSMMMLIISRFIQGVGAGALMPIATTIVGDIYDKRERAKIQGYLSSVWGISAVSGPLLGGLFVDILNWRYVFWMNIPLGLLAMFGIIMFLKEDIKKEKPHIDYAGAVWIVIAITALMFILVEGGVSLAWTSPLMISLIAVAVISLSLFVYQQFRAPDPMMPFEIWKYRIILIANLASLIAGMIVIGVSSYLPAFVQGVMGHSATVAGFAMTAMSIGWPIASTIAGRVLLKIGYRSTCMIGGVLLILGGALFMLLTPDKGPLWAAVASFFIGGGMGLTSTSFIVGIQSSVGWSIRGIATAANLFMRSLGSALGAAFLGGLLNKGILNHIDKEGWGDTLSVDSTNLLLDHERRASLPTGAVDVLQVGLTNGLHIVYTGLFFLAILMFIMVLMMPRKEAED